MCQQVRVAMQELAKVLSRGKDQETVVYPRDILKDFFDSNDGRRIRELGNCKCSNQGCAAQLIDENVIDQIRKRGFFSVLGFLCFIGRTDVIQMFIKHDYTDERLHTDPLKKEQYFELFSPPGGPMNNQFPKNPFDIYKFDFFKFFLPSIGGNKAQVVSPLQKLPLDIFRKVGQGSYGAVSAAELLDKRYYAFPYPEDRLVAVKKYIDSEQGRADWEKEHGKNLLYSHPNIMPLLASIGQGDEFMNVYPYAECDLHHLFNGERGSDHTPRFIWGQFMNLLSALDHIHESLPLTYGYHFDLKPGNILVRNSKWIIADLGMAYNKTKDGLSLTTRQKASEEFGAPETDSTRKVDIWAIACVGCNAMAWLLEGSTGVENFRNKRAQQDGIAKLYNFYSVARVRGGPDSGKRSAETYHLQDEVVSLLSKAKSSEDETMQGAAKILMEMLSLLPKDRPTAKEAEEKFGKLLNQRLLAVQKPARQMSAQQLAVPGHESSPLRVAEAQNESLEFSISAPGPLVNDTPASIIVRSSSSTYTTPGTVSPQDNGGAGVIVRIGSPFLSPGPPRSMVMQNDARGTSNADGTSPSPSSIPSIAIDEYGNGQYPFRKLNYEDEQRMPGDWPVEAESDSDCDPLTLCDKYSGSRRVPIRWPLPSVSMAFSLLLKRVRRSQAKTADSRHSSIASDLTVAGLVSSSV